MTKEHDLNSLIDLMTTIDGRQSYLDWVAQWKAEYARLIVAIRETKAARKPYLYAYRAKGDTEAQKRTRIGDNPTYSTGAAWHRDVLREQAETMLGLRSSTKAMGIARKMAERENAAA